MLPNYHEYKISPRRLEERWPKDLPRYWYRNEAFATHFMNCMSPLFPPGEQLFIDSVRAFRDQNTDPQLEAEIKGFIGQEAWHRKEHMDYDRWLTELGYPANKMEQFTGWLLEFFKKIISKKSWLATTVCLEHFTAIMAHVLLVDRQFHQETHPHMAKVWTWHAIEEIEHKAVAWDLYQTVKGGYARRVLMMLFLSVAFPLHILGNLGVMLAKDGKLLSPKTWWQGARFLLWRPGVLLKIAVPYLKFYSPWFHPWQEDERHLIHKWTSALNLSAPQRG